ncbi:hypothetical protein H0H92_000537 [Tricholoma furcatifolium]|nr:hypothetical protein H0H92_000537 [Tricholoma furcatifolium]
MYSFTSDVRAINIPPEKYGHWYTVLAIEGIPGIGPFTLSSLDKGQALTPFVSDPFATISIKLFAKHKMQAWRSDVLIAQGIMRLDSWVKEVEVTLTPTADYMKKIPSDPTLVFTITTFKRADLANVQVNPTFFEIDPKLSEAMEVVRRIVKVGMAFAGVSPIAKMVFSLVDIGVFEYDALVKRNNAVLLLIEQIGQASVLITDWDNDDDPSHIELRPNQERVCRELLPEILQCLNFLQQLSQSHHGMSLSEQSIRKVDYHRKSLNGLIIRLESNRHLDTQTAVFEVKKTVEEVQEDVHTNFTSLRNDGVLHKLRVSVDAGSAGSKICLKGTRVALIERICDWALDPNSERTLLLTGAAGKAHPNLDEASC